VGRTKAQNSVVGAVATAVAVWASLSGAAAAQALFNTGDGVFSAKVTSLRDMPFRTVVRQQYDFSCGSASLATLLHHHYRRPVSETEVFKAMYDAGDQAKIRQVGFSLLDMKLYLQSLGLVAAGYREDLGSVAKRARPAIAVITVGDYRHFVVIKGVRNGQVLVGDPSLGLKVYTVAEFRRVWNGVTFFIEDGPQDQGEFNRPEEWRSTTRAALEPLDDTALSSFTRELPPIYQITPIIAVSRSAF
jgi:predicted double-glycine peptidase